jgi:hypothetical protein
MPIEYCNHANDLIECPGAHNYASLNTTLRASLGGRQASLPSFDEINRLKNKNAALVDALLELMTYHPREYWEGVGANLYRKTAGSAISKTLDKCDVALSYGGEVK